MNTPFSLFHASSSARRGLAFLILLVAATLSWGGQFTLDGGKPTGGTATNSPPIPTTYQWNDPSYGASSTGSGSDSCSGAITYAWTWQGTDAAPSSVVLKVEAHAQWTGPPGACNDGLGQNDPFVNSYAGPTLVSQSQNGTRYVVANVTNGHLTYQITPTASATSSTCNVSVKVSILLDQETGAGPVDDGGGGRRMAIGQLLSLKLYSTAPQTPTDTYIWTVSGGAPFSNYQASGSQGAYTPYAAPPITSDTMSCYFAKVDAVTVTCTHYSGYDGQTITSTYTVQVKAPTRILVESNRANMVLLKGDQVWQPGQGYPSGYSLYGVQYENRPKVGMFDVNTLLDPALCGRGQCGYVQIGDRTSTTNGVSQHFSGLDGGFLYYPSVPSNGTTPAIFDDTPGLASFLGSGTYHGSFSGDYRCYFMYKPADDAAGASVYVPIFKLLWGAKGHCDTTDGINWTQGDDGSYTGARTLSDGSRGAFPEWP